jgi:ABC-type phosphate transport system substrate-binding protein
MSCGGEEKIQEAKLSVLCDEGVYNLCKTPIKDFDSLNYSVKIELKSMNAFDCMAKLLAVEAEAVVLARDYSAQEDSLLKSYKVKPYFKAPVAYDALVLYTNADNKIDTLNDKDIKNIFLSNEDLGKFNSNFNNAEIVCNSAFSSEYMNFKHIALKDEKVKKRIKHFNASDSAIQYVINNKNTIGIGYLSQINRQSDLKCIKIGFTNEKGAYVAPHLVHQANIVQGLYPYKSTIYIYLSKENDLTQTAFSRFMTKSGIAQKYFNESGIVPAFGKIRITIQE